MKFYLQPRLVIDLAKAKKRGEGSRGGKIIGHTKSGKPIYAANHTAYALDGTKRGVKPYKDFTAQDHEDAYQLHRTAHLKGGPMMNKHQDASWQHAGWGADITSQARAKARASKKRSPNYTTSSNPVSGDKRGVVGHTRSGKPIYAAHSKSHYASGPFRHSAVYKDYTEEDHRDAMALHTDNHNMQSSFLNSTHEDAADRHRERVVELSTRAYRKEQVEADRDARRKWRQKIKIMEREIKREKR